MRRSIGWGVAAVVLFATGVERCGAQTLGETLSGAQAPTAGFSAAELGETITSFAISRGEPFLLAYYVDDGSGRLRPPLRVIRYSRRSRQLQRAEFQEVTALFRNELPMGCLGSAWSIQEAGDVVYIGTHVNPSAGCVIVLSTDLKLKNALSGWTLAVMGDFAIVRASEIHFAPVHAMNLEVYDAMRNEVVKVYPYEGDRERQRYSELLKPLIVEEWCRNHNSACDPDWFDVSPGKMTTNEAAGVFWFEAHFSARGFGEGAEATGPARDVVYVYRMHGGRWEHREFPAEAISGLFGVESVEELVNRKPNAPFAAP